MFHKQKIASLPQANFKWGEFRNREAAGPTATLFRAFHYDGLDKQVTCYYNIYATCYLFGAQPPPHKEDRA